MLEVGTARMADTIFATAKYQVLPATCEASWPTTMLAEALEGQGFLPARFETLTRFLYCRPARVGVAAAAHVVVGVVVASPNPRLETSTRSVCGHESGRESLGGWRVGAADQ